MLIRWEDARGEQREVILRAGQLERMLSASPKLAELIGWGKPEVADETDDLELKEDGNVET